jgi:hypothetical protein
MTSRRHSTGPLARRVLAAPARLAVLALGVGACSGQDPVAPGDGGGTAGPDTEIPTTDEGLAYDAETLQSIDADILSIPDDVVGLTLEDVRHLQASTLTNVDPAPELVIMFEPGVLYNEEWDAYAVGDGQLTFASFEGDMETLRTTSSSPLDDSGGFTDEEIEILESWEVSIEEATEIALPIAPGEVLTVRPSADPSPLMFVVVRQEDGSVVRVAIDSATGEAVNVVEPTAAAGDEPASDTAPSS